MPSASCAKPVSRTSRAPEISGRLPTPSTLPVRARQTGPSRASSPRTAR